MSDNITIKHMYLGIKHAHLCLCLTNLKYREICDTGEFNMVYVYVAYNAKTNKGDVLEPQRSRRLEAPN